MSKESLEWLNNNTLIGFTEKRGTAWHYRADLQNDAEPNHYVGAVPVADVKRRLFGWEAVSSPVYVESPVTGGLVEAEGRQAILRSDNGHLMGIFTDGYTPHPYVEWLINTIATLLEDDLSIGSAGLLKNGAVAWVSVEVPDNIKTPEGVEFRPHLFGATSFDGSLATTFKRAITNIVCDNTMAAGLAESGQQIKIRHSRNSRLRIGEARDALNIIYQVADDFAAEVEQLCNTRVSDAEWDAFLDAHAPLPEEDKGRSRTMAENKRESLTRLWNHDNRVSTWRNTAWGVVQAVNTYTHHEQTVRGAGRVERNMLRAVTGGVDDLDQATLRTLATVRGEPVSARAA
jgi:phage/plasmid-like protein (TIGR03299 family)